jgi:hypothetical protein
VWRTARGYWGQYNVWGTARCHFGLNIRYGEAPDKTEDAGGAMLVEDRERFETLTAESLRISAVVNVHPSLIDVEMM